MLGSSLPQLRAIPAIPSKEKGFFFTVTTFTQAIDLEEKPSFPNYKTTHAVGTFLHELPMMCSAFNPEIFPAPTQGTNRSSLGGRGNPLAVLGGCGHAWELDQPPTSGRFASLSVLQIYQGITTVRIRAWIYLLQPGCAFCKRLKAAWPCLKSLLIFFLACPHAVHAAAVTHSPGVSQPVAAPASPLLLPFH